MPTYEYRCEAGHVFERFLPISGYKAPQTCDCGKGSERYFSTAPKGFVQRECVYDSPIDGRPITSWAQRREDMARNGCQEYDPGMKQDYERRIRDSETRLDKEVEASLDAAIEQLPTRKKEALEQELRGGADATIERGSVPISTVSNLA